MDGGNADSDHSMTWEDFFGSTTELAPTLIGIYDSFLEPKNSGPEASRFDLNAKDARNDPPLEAKPPKEEQPTMNEIEVTNDPKIAKIPNKSSLYTIRTKITENGANETTNETFIQKSSLYKPLKSFKNDKVSDIGTTPNTFDNLSPNVKRIISSATETAVGFKFQKRTTTIRSSGRHKSNIPLVGATSKISQSGLEIIPSVEICDLPSGLKTKQNEVPVEIPPKTFKAEFKLGTEATYDVPKNKEVIYDVPTKNKTAFESLSLPYIDQSIELSITSNDREFDTKLSSKENSPDKPKISPIKIQNLSASNGSGSTGNLPEKDVRLHPPPEVIRPLSMSSIASSSSTSSSGVQHKGGVNSAYLASIESLDDHSDADVASGMGSNSFVHTAGIKNITEERRAEAIPNFNASDELSGLSQLERVCAEIVQTENVYVEDLRQVVEGYQHVWRKEAVFSDEDLADLFNNIEDIYSFNRSLCEELNTCRLEAISIAKCFVDHNTGFTVYTSYCTGYPRTMERLAVLASRPHSARVFRERQMALGHPLPLASYLLKPVQRILKYHLLLQNVVKLCACRETEFALLKMTGIAQHIDDMKRKHEHSVRVQEIQSLLYGWIGPDLTTYGELCAEGTFRVFGAKAMRHVFLFDKMLLITKNREDGILAYKSHIMCNNMMLVEAISGAPLSFHVIPWDAPRAQITLQATTQRHKREWTLLLKRAILENYNAVIPSHARQLVMELGQNRTDDDILAEKSHNLITQASMRKQLSAPEYLEKRKLERERRKSFENGARGRIKKSRKPTIPIARRDQCDCAQISTEKGRDVTCENCYIDLCSDCETEFNNISKEKDEKCDCKNEDTDKCPECDRYLHYIDSGSAENLERKPTCKCLDFKSSQESVGKEFPLNKVREYHSSDNIINYDTKELNDIRLQKTCLKCAKIKENIVLNESVNTLRPRKSRYNDLDKRSDTIRSKSKDDPQRSRLSKIGTWRRKSEPGLQQNSIIPKRSLDEEQGNEKIEFECRNCGSNKITKKVRSDVIFSDPEFDKTRTKTGVEIKMYNSKNIPKKISKLKKNRAKSLRHAIDTTAKFYADLSTDVSTENILHISESTDSLNVGDENATKLPKKEISIKISKDEDIDEETYKRLIEKTDSFKKNELEKVKYLNKQNVIKEGTEAEGETVDKGADNCKEPEEPLEQIISQLLMQNREYQKLLKKQQLRNTAQRRHQRLLKSHSNPEPSTSRYGDQLKFKPKFGRQSSENLDFKLVGKVTTTLSPPNEEDSDDDHIYETLRVVPKEHLEADKLEIPNKPNAPESDYVYLSFDQLNKIKSEDDDGIYDVPVKRNEKVLNTKTDYYVPIEIQGVRSETKNVYDSLVEVRKRQKEPIGATDYLPMNAATPNTEIWLTQQKEHFNVSRDRKSGSLPRSFQVVTSTSEDNNLSTFRSKPPTSKTYLNRDGKVLSIDRPFTIASDQSEISFDEVENYIGDGDILKLNKNSPLGQSDVNGQNISQSTLELEEEIDRCYKSNFEKINLDANKNENLLTVSQSNLESVASSCEALTGETDENNDTDAIHPENKIYKPTSNMLSLKNVLSRFKSKNANKTDAEVNSNEPSSPDSTSSDMKSPTSEKRPALNPRSYSKSLLQRFRNIIGDEQTDDSVNKNEKSPLKTKIKVVVTSTDNNPVNTVANDPLSKSVSDDTTITDSQNEKRNLEILSHSCDEINKEKTEVNRPIYERNSSVVSSTASTMSPSKSNASSYQSLNKLPIYMQGSKQLGSRIAQSDYVDPTTLIEKSGVNNVNILINKNAVRPDSLFSNSSFVTSSSEGNYQTPRVDPKPVEDATNVVDSYENIYEKSFEKIEQVTGEDVFRDSAVYSDQEDDVKQMKPEKVIKESVKIKSSFTVSSSIQESKTLQTKLTVTGSKIQAIKEKPLMSTRSKIAPPVPVKPKRNELPLKPINIAKNKDDQATNTIKRNTNIKHTYLRAESFTQTKARIIEPNTERPTETPAKINEQNPFKHDASIKLTRMSFERSSLDSATRKLRNQSEETNTIPVESKNVTKTVLERRMEIESLSKNSKVNIARKPSQIARPKTAKIATSDNSESTNIPVNSISAKESDECKESWVKQVVNKFQ